ncbi:hypothetical protein SARC_13429, partial [Sphaeroforma arctica JP610]
MYPLSKFGIFKDTKFHGKPIQYPAYMMTSDNFSSRKYANTSHRRLKNVCVIMEWIPDVA